MTSESNSISNSSSHKSSARQADDSGFIQSAGPVTDALVRSILEGDPATRHLSALHLPDKQVIIRLLDKLRSILFPGFFGLKGITAYSVRDHITDLAGDLQRDLVRQVSAALIYMHELDRTRPDLPIGRAECDELAQRIAIDFMSQLPELRRLLALDVRAAMLGDPAARHTDEIIFCYPGMLAIMAHRAAHRLHRLRVPLLPRIMSEHAHSQTGIDIHPGAAIGESFFIDHGTGVVIGETTIIGDFCKIYQGVTLGARSFPTDERGQQLMRGHKRHPTLGNRVVVYAGATILGGDTVIGDDCVIGGGVFLTRSVPPGYTVRSTRPELQHQPDPSTGFFEGEGSGI